MDEHFFTADDEVAGERLDKFLADTFAGYSRVQLQDLIKAGQVKVNDSLGKAKAAYRLELGDVIGVILPDNTPKALEGKNIELEVVYEDEALAVINKPAGMVVHPGVGEEGDTLVHALLARYPHIASVGEADRPGIVHRLDKDTSGLVMVALTSEAQQNLMAQFQARTVQKIYWALTERAPKTETGRIEAPIARDPKQRKRMAVVSNGKLAVSEFRLLEAFEPYSLLEINLETGRTHQIRVHLTFIGCPVVGDTVYGYRKQTIKLGRLFLHAKTLSFTHPVTGEAMHFDSPLPQKLENILEQLRAKAESEAQASRLEE